MTPLIRLGGYGALLGGGLRIASALIAYDPQAAWQEVLFAAIDLSLLAALAGLYLHAGGGLGRTGRAALVLGIAATASVIGPDAVKFGIDFYQLGSAVLVLALAVVATVCLLRRMLQATAALWLAAAALGFASTVTGSAPLFVLAGAVLGLGFVLLGKALLSQPRARPGQHFALNQITLGSNDHEAGAAFYRKLGLVQIVDSPANGYARFEAPDGNTLSLHRSQGEAAVGAAVVYFECEALDDWCAALAASGIAFDQLPRDESWGWREARLRDPAGNVLCLYRAGRYRRFPPWRLAAA
jgi:catechol 2,3-dioxygenase-like lactoylglutathione lyase family enzyme